ncbi:MAG: transglycosylase domain-containing protein [Bacillota bacterium]
MTKKKKKKNKFLSFLKFVLIFGIIVGLIGGGISLYLIKDALDDVKEINPSKINERLVENSVILDNQGNELEKLQRNGARTLIKYQDMSNNLINAYISIEDKTFFEHSGFNFIRMAGAVKDSLLTDKRIGGTSTITQQLARNIYLINEKYERSITRKIKEAYYAIQLEKYLTKEQIIEAYLNTIYLGSNSKGVQAASQKYFSKDAENLNLYESAILAGIPKNPTKYQPMFSIKTENITDKDVVIKKKDELYSYIFNEDCESRYKTVINLMEKNGYITKAQKEEAFEINIPDLLNPSIERGTEISSYFSDMVEDEVVNDLIEKRGYTKKEAVNLLYTGGLKIYSTIDFNMQKTLENAYAKNNFTKFFGYPTRDAVKELQRKFDLQIDGMVGPGTKQKLIDLQLINKDDIKSNVLKYGMESDEVVKLKQGLFKANLFSSNELFPKVTVTFNKDGHIISKNNNQKIILYKKSKLIDENKNLVLSSSDFKFDENDNLILYKNNKLNFYSQYKDGKLERIQVVLENLFSYDKENNKNITNRNGTVNIVDLYSYEGGEILIPNEYKSFDDDGNLIVDSRFINSNDNFIKQKNGNLVIPENKYYLSEKGTIQPQSAMVILDYRTGQLKAIVGGRNLKGQKIYNRALNSRQPGSSVKPFAVYTPAIDSKNYTAASVIDDIPTYLSGNDEKRWPINWYEQSRGFKYKYRGISTLREGLEQSMNVVTVKLANTLGIQKCIEYMKKFGITTIVDEGRNNDHNLSSVALGGMTRGIKPIELVEAFGTFGNNGTRMDTISYTEVIDSNGDVILNNKPDKTLVIEEDVSFIIRDMIRSTVTKGTATKAQIRKNNKGIPVAGKTGTTSSKYDAWFTGITPYYAGVTWFGTDYNIPLDEGSAVSSEFWSYVMKNIHKDLPDRDFSKPDNIIQRSVDTKSGKIPTNLSYMDPRNTVISEYFIQGTQPTETDDVHVQANICKESGKLATEYCPTTLIESKVFTERLNGEYDPEEHKDKYGNPIHIKDEKYILPTEECDIHLETIDISEDISDDNTGNSHFKFYDNQTAIVINPVRITLKDDKKLFLPLQTRILKDKKILLPDNSIVKPQEINQIPYYEKELQNFLEEKQNDNNEENEDTDTNIETEIN